MPNHPPGYSQEIMEEVVDRLLEEKVLHQGFLYEVKSHLFQKLLEEEGAADVPPYFRAMVLEKIPPLTLSRPPGQKKIPPLRQALGAGMGVFLGSILLRPLFLATGIDPVTGLFFSSLLGAVLFTFFLAQLTTSPTLRKGLLLLTGMGTIGELLAFSVNPFSFLSRLPTQRWKRYSLYLLLPFIYLISSPREEVIREHIRPQVEQVLFLWTFSCRNILQLELESFNSKEEREGRELEIQALLPALYGLYHSPREELETNALALFQTLRSFGYAELTEDGAFKKDQDRHAPPLIWSKDLHTKYNCFGYIQEGDRVIIEKPVVVKDDRVLMKGLVRRFKKTRSAGEEVLHG